MASLQEKPRGEFLHETRGLQPAAYTRPIPILKHVLKKELIPIIPLFAAMGAALGLVGWISTRELLASPEIRARLNKTSRSSGVPEMEDAENMETMGKKYLKSTFLRDFVRSPMFEPILRFQAMPSRFAYHENPELAQARENANKRASETGKTENAQA